MAFQINCVLVNALGVHFDEKNEQGNKSHYTSYIKTCDLFQCLLTDRNKHYANNTYFHV